MTVIMVDPNKHPASATNGIQEAINALPETGGTVFIPAGRYFLRSSLKVKARVMLRGEGGATVLTPQKMPIVRKAAKSVKPGDTHLTFQDTSGLEVGDQLHVFDSACGGWNSRYAVITGIKGERVWVEIIYGDLNTEYSVERNALATNYFPGIWATRVDDVTLESLCLDGGEYKHEEKYTGGFMTAAIHTKNVNNLRIRDISIRRWPADGISVQGKGRTAIVSGCIVEDCLSIGMHPGTGISRSIWIGNISRCNGSGFFFCVGCKNTICANNLMLNNKGPGIHGLGDPDRYNVVVGNICAGNGEAGIDASKSFGNIISNNLCRENSGNMPGVYPGLNLELHQNNVLTGNLLLDDREIPTQIRGIQSLRPSGNNLIKDNYCSGGMLIEDRNVERENANLKAVLDAGTSVTPRPVTPAQWGRPVFTDDFNTGKISGKWKPDGDNFKIVEGMLTGYQKISIAKTFSAKAVRMEYDVLVMSEVSVSDASMMAEMPGFSLLAKIGGDYNTASALRINRDWVAERSGAVLLRCRRQRVAVELGAGKIVVKIDGNPFLEYAGRKTPKTLKNLTLSLYAWTPGIHFGSVKVHVIK